MLNMKTGLLDKILAFFGLCRPRKHAPETKSQKKQGGSYINHLSASLLCLEEDKYPLTCKPTGLCLIINNENFQDGTKRSGTQKDAESLADVFSWLGFQVLMFQDQTASDMARVTKLLADLKYRKRLVELILADLKDMFDAGDRMVPELQSQLLQRLKLVDLKHLFGLLECNLKEWSDGRFTPLSRHRCIRLGHGDAFVCCVLSHGDEDVVSGVDGKTLPIIDITSAFNGEHCPALIGKPKVFFIQACQGPNLHTGWTVDDLPFHWQKPKADKGRQTKKEHHPNEADYLVSKATVAKYPAFRDENTGSYFMQSLCKQLRMGCARGEDILKILVDVNADVSKEDFGQNCSEKQMLKQMPEFRVTLRHALVFSPCFRRET
ncbi:caspase-8 isoform X1 [Gadus morhua]|uniref:caspase-8 isoform X1 n=1 Tax=Gadus morhua TaxID=8049 RepID=UPI0011B6C647|nr:caspase-8-like isoform X1 [Gadus morhua]